MQKNSELYKRVRLSSFAHRSSSLGCMPKAVARTSSTEGANHARICILIAKNCVVKHLKVGA
ncbi:hypothetical protein BKK44_22390 [Bacillus cereus]|nr:hypothetical protein BKK44_22390 [Bacillus cereus]